MENELKQFGFVPPVLDDTQYILGASKIIPVILQHDGDWSAYLPRYESQVTSKYDSFGCTVYGTENVIQTMIKKIFNEDANYSERYIYNLAGINPPGADPHYVAEVVRLNGLIDQDELPITRDFDEFKTPRPMESKYLVKGQHWLNKYSFLHQWIWTRPQTNEQRLKLIKEHLMYSPLGVSVTAWFEENGVYVDKGLDNTHWCMIYKISERGYEVFDSYNNSRKTLSFDHNIFFAKGYHLEPKSDKQKVMWLTGIVKALIEMAKDLLSGPRIGGIMKKLGLLS